jgi:hypothetical protein
LKKCGVFWQLILRIMNRCSVLVSNHRWKKFVAAPVPAAA